MTEQGLAETAKRQTSGKVRKDMKLWRAVIVGPRRIEEDGDIDYHILEKYIPFRTWVTMPSIASFTSICIVR